MSDASKAKQWVFRIIQPSDGYLPSRVFDIGIMALIAISVLSVFMATFSVSEDVSAVMKKGEFVMGVVFSVEYFLRLWTADLLHPELPPWRARARYVFSWLALVDLVAILPLWLPMFLHGHLLSVRSVRLIRLLRVFKLNRYMEAMAAIGDVFVRKRRELVASGIFILVLMLLSSLFMYHAEHAAQPDKFRNAFSGLWWAVATLTTVGYGDIYPVTAAGRFLGAVIAILGIGMVAIPTSILSSGFLEHFRSRERSSATIRCPHCGKEIPLDESHNDETSGRAK